MLTNLETITCIQKINIFPLGDNVMSLWQVEAPAMRSRVGNKGRHLGKHWKKPEQGTRRSVHVLRPAGRV